MNWRDEIAAEFARRRKDADPGVVEELAQHADAAYEAARADGEHAAAAEAAVRTLIRSWCEGTTGPQRLEGPALIEASSGTSLLSGLSLDLRLALRLIRRQPAYAVTSIAMIALAIGATTSLFSVVNGVLLRPLPCCKGDGLVRVFDNVGQWTSTTPLVTNLTYRAWMDDEPQTIDGLGAWSEVSMSLDAPSGIELVRAARVTASLFPLLGVAPSLGTSFTTADERSDNTVILSHGFWQERFGGAPDALGKRVTVGGTPRTIVGVMPRGFEFPSRDQRMWLPVHVQPVIRPGTHDVSIRTFNVLARLKPGVTAAQAASEAAARNAALPMAGNETMRTELFGGNGVPVVTVTPMLDWMVKDVKPALWILLAAVTLLFAAAAGNVANMQLARAIARRREVAIRTAIGAGAGRLARQLFVETFTVAAIGGVLGFGLTLIVMRALPALLPEDFPRAQDVAIDSRVLAVVTLLTMAVSVLMSLLPVRMAQRLNVTSALVEDGSAPTRCSLRSPGARARTLIITGQIAVAALLLVGAALLSQSFLEHVTIDRGYEPANMLTARITHLGRGLPAGARTTFYKDVLERLSAVRGVTHAALTNSLPLTPADGGADFWPDRSNKFSQTLVLLRLVSADYFDAMGMHITRGRGFTGRETPASDPVILVNETFVSRYLTGDPLDAPVALIADQGRPDLTAWRVIGVVADVKHRRADEPVKPEVFATQDQLSAGLLATQYVTVRTAGDPAALAADLRAIVRGAGANAVVEQVMTMDRRLMMSLSRPRLYAVLLAGFGTFALLIAALGIFGGLSYGVTQRTREIGVRTALGATPRDIVSLVVKQGVLMTLVGLAAGLAAAAASVRLLSGFLFGVQPLDPVSFAVVGVVLTLVAAVACALPARRAARIDPVVALRG